MSYREEFEDELLDAEWGGFPLDILRTSDSFDRSVVRHKHPNVDGALLRDTGGEPRETTCTVVFLPPQVIERLTEFVAMVMGGEALRFVHPFFGSYLAHAERLRVSASGDQRDFASLEVSFVEEAASTTFDDLATNTDFRQGVDSAAADLDAELAAAGLESDVGADAVAKADEWEASDIADPRKLNLELNELNNEIMTATEELELAINVSRYPIMVALGRLQNNLRNLASRLMSTAPKLTTHTVKVAQPLLAISQELYGGKLAVERCDDLLELNDLADPAFVPAGTVLTVRVPE